jgi:DNA-binding beta-propeller fold protein YncE
VSEQTPSDPGGFVPGSRIAGYRLEEQIGRGGMAVVFRAHDQRLDRQVALKILAPGLALDDAFRQRFIRESRAAAAVDDPHIIPVFEAGEAAGVLFIAMRYVRDGDVRTLLDREGPLSPARTTEIISQVASALDNAHLHGLVHRDVKPANMLLGVLAGPDRPDHVYLSDFGLSKQSLAPSGLTSTGQFLGTLDYVAPEQIEGRTVDGRADLYALACAAFELLSGAPPFRRDQGLAVVYAQLSEPPPSLSARRADMTPAVDRIFARALAKSPADRFATCRDFAAALRQVFGLRPVDSGPGSAPAGWRPATEIAMPSAGPHGAGSAQPWTSAPGAAAAQGGLEQSLPSAGPPTQAAGIQGGGTTPGLTDPRYGPPGSTDPRYGPPGIGTGAGGGQGYGPVGGPGYAPVGGPKRRSRKPAAAAAAAVAVLLIAGGAFFVLHHGSGGTKGPIITPLAVPGCTTKTASAPELSDKVGTKFVQLGGQPFAVKVRFHGQYSFVSLGKSVAVLKNGPGLTFSPVGTITDADAQKGEAVTKDGRYLLVAGDSGAVVINLKEAKQDPATSVVGHLQSPGGQGAVEVAISPDDNFAFVTLQTTGKMAVFNLQTAEHSHFRKSGFVGFVPLGLEPVGMSESAGKWLYVTSMKRNQSTNEGTVSVIDIAKAETSPSTAVIATAGAGCNPSRVITSADGSVVWVTTQLSNALLAFNAAELRAGRAHSLIAKVAVGQSPIGETFIKGGSEIVIADSDKYNTAGSSPNLEVVNTKDALAGKPALVGWIPTGKQPRQFDLEGSTTLLVTNTASGQLEAVNLADIP